MANFCQSIDYVIQESSGAAFIGVKRNLACLLNALLPANCICLFAPDDEIIRPNLP
jgi:hypothetical protein